MTPDLMEDRAQALSRAMNTPTNAGESGGREAGFSRIATAGTVPGCTGTTGAGSAA